MTMHDGSRDFDFFVGRWRIDNRRLRERLKGSQEWEEFEGTLEARTVLGGLGNVDEIVMERDSGRVHGLTLRLYNPHSRQWSLYWSSSLDGVLYTPMIGEFTDGVGKFYSQEPFEGRAIFSRFIWSAITLDSCRWEQAFSADGGATWETNWIMDFTRLS